MKYGNKMRERKCQSYLYYSETAGNGGFAYYSDSINRLTWDDIKKK